MTNREIEKDYEKNTGVVIAEAFGELNPMHIPALLMRNHGPFTWGKNAWQSVFHASVLEEIAQMSYQLFSLQDKPESMPQALLDKHFLRKHGENAYYGQNKADS